MLYNLEMIYCISNKACAGNHICSYFVCSYNIYLAVIYDLAHFVESHYGSYAITCDDYGELYDYMCHDKKNVGDEVRFALLRSIGQCVTDVPVEQQEIEIVLDFIATFFTCNRANIFVQSAPDVG